MLKDLSIKNLVLMDLCQISFHENFSTLTGETGAGKTAILHSLKLLLGGKLDTSLIRSGEKKGSVQGVFIFDSKALEKLLEDAGVSWEDNTLILFREVSAEGKSKSFINDRAVSLSFLQKVSAHLLQIVDQSSYHELKQTDTPRLLLDLFASLEKELATFSTAFETLQQYKKQQKVLVARGEQKEREFDFLLQQQEELNGVNLQEGEEESLFQEYALSSRSQEILEKTETLSEILNGNSHPVLSSLAECKALCKSLANTHEIFKEGEKLLVDASFSLNEVLELITSSFSTFDTDPGRLEILETQLSTIDRVKKKYGASVEARLSYKKGLQEKIALFESLEVDLLDLERALIEAEKKLQALASALSKKRTSYGKKLESALQTELQHLNMKDATITIAVEKQQMCSTGEDKVSFFLKANIGEETSNIKESSSGGELSRLLLAFKLILAEKNRTPTLIFDEIDANVGGETATLIGEKLKKLSSYRQVICITHFPQVACQGHLHLRVEKSTSQNRTLATVVALTEKERSEELLRMLGGKKSSLSL
jgi:DNA repair protein RecN (Recombination protein N)